MFGAAAGLARTSGAANPAARRAYGAGRDAVCLALAESTGRAFVTADARLLRKLEGVSIPAVLLAGFAG